ncbi:MAG: hypothetical protein AAFU49_00395 [Pseudomonadota bacterium]
MRVDPMPGLAGRLRAATERWPATVRWWLGGAGSVVLSILAMAAMPLWLPKGSAGIDHIVFPVVLFPAIWAAVFFYVVLEGSPVRCLCVMLGATAINIALIAMAFLGGDA